MKYVVHLYPTFVLAVQIEDAKDHEDAVKQALAVASSDLLTDLAKYGVNAVNIPKNVTHFDDAEEIASVLVDEVPDIEHLHSQSYRLVEPQDEPFMNLNPNKTICEGCNNDIDLDTCCCGEPKNGHHDNHYFRPMGCTCGYAERVEKETR